MTKQSTGAHFAWSFWIALLGLAAFHLRLFDGNSILRQASHLYMLRAINAHGRELDGGLNKDNAARIAAACAIISVHATNSHNYFDAKDSAEKPHFWFLPLQRGLALFRLTTPLMQKLSGSSEHPGFEAGLEMAHEASYSNPFSFLLFHLAASDATRDDMCAYTEAVNHLSYLYADIQHKRPFRFTVPVSAHFVDLVAVKDPRALAITGYFFMLAKKGSPCWWFDTLPERGFATVMGILPAAWLPAMDWAVREFAWNGGEETKAASSLDLGPVEVSSHLRSMEAFGRA